MISFKNAKLFTENFTYKTTTFSIENGKFTKIGCPPEPSSIDLQGQKVLPGIIDIHTHGIMGEDFSDGKLEGLKIMVKSYAKNGITSFCPTSLMIPYNRLRESYQNALELKKNPIEKGSKIIGIDMEGPYYTKFKEGAQNPDYLRIPDYDQFKKLYDDCEGIIKIVCLAPELNGALEFIDKVKKNNLNTIISIADTQCDYNVAKKAINVGANEITHLFNKMNGIHHRESGPIIAAMENENVFSQLITDGHHIHPAIVRFAFKCFGAERMIIISDSIRCCGCPDGEYDYLETKCYLKDDVPRLKDGTIAGSCTNCYECMKRAISFGIKEEDAIRAATYNPAKHLGIDNEVGLIKEGLSADFIIADQDLNIKKVYINGTEI